MLADLLATGSSVLVSFGKTMEPTDYTDFTDLREEIASFLNLRNLCNLWIPIFSQMKPPLARHRA
jgi:hypothetical protein